MKKLVLTGAAGRLGSYLREPLSKLCDELVSSDIATDLGKLYPGERYHRADLARFDEIDALLDGADMVVHFGAISDEAPFETLLGPNFIGAYNIWESAHRNGLRRVVYASSIHAVGMYKRQEFIGTDVPHRPDTFYGLSKCFAEDLARLYWDKRGLESVCLRILSAAQVTSSRALAETALELGLAISFSGVITFKNSQELRDIARDVPLDRLLVETDAPFLAPVPHRGKRNEPAFVAATAAVLAGVKGVSADEIASVTAANTRRIFHKMAP